MTQTEIDELEERVAKGIGWLSSHDPDGAFHFNFVSGILPRSPKPAWSPERIQAYTDYHKARTVWEQLYAKLDRAERKAKEAATA